LNLLRAAISWRPFCFAEPDFPISLSYLRLLAVTESNNLLLRFQDRYMSSTFINPESLGVPRGYSNGVLTEAGGKLLFVAGQVGWDARQTIVSDDFVEQFDRALANVLTVVGEAGGRAQDIVRMVLYVTSRTDYLNNTQRIGEQYRERMGKHFPAMVLVEVKGLLDSQAKIEIEAVAVINS
jgi:enamine deaminase RidA (YjgF/YER057c/UK114 family)